MKFVNPTCEILESRGILKDIELAARTCYQSYDAITEDDSSAKKMVKSLVDRNHYAMLEFGENLSFLVYEYEMTELMKYICHKPFFKAINFTYLYQEYVISFNPRVALELKNYIETINTTPILRVFYNSIVSLLPEEIVGKRSENISNYIKEKPLKIFDVLTLPSFKEDMENHITKTVRFTTNRGVTHEAIRHRLCSFAERSTRYVEDKDDIIYLKPVWMNEESNDIETDVIFEASLIYNESSYQMLRERGWKKQQAREVLANSLGTEIVLKATISEWRHIFELRTAKDAHPEMIRIMTMIEEMFKLNKII